MALRKLKKDREIIDRAIKTYEKYREIENEVKTHEETLREKKKEMRKLRSELKGIDRLLVDSGFDVQLFPLTVREKAYEKVYPSYDQLKPIPPLDVANAVTKRLNASKERFLEVYGEKTRALLEKSPSYASHFTSDLIFKIMKLAAEEEKITSEQIADRIKPKTEGLDRYSENTIRRRVVTLKGIDFLVQLEKDVYAINSNYCQ